LSGSELDSVYNKFLQVRAPQLAELPQTLAREDLKCGFDIVTTVKMNFNNFSADQQKLLEPLVSRPVLETSMDSPYGYFRIHYNSSGPSAPSYIPGTVTENVMEVAKALDSTYRFEVTYLDYLPPPSDNGAGGNNLYDVYIVNQPSGLYGYTELELRVGPTSWTSFAVIDNNYVGYYSQGLDGMEVTVAHEFHHGIQVGNYAVLNGTSPLRSGDVFFYEITSTSMEEFVYDDVNDYYAYMPDYFMNVDKAFPNQNGYNLAIWNLYLKERFNYDLIKRQWEMIPILEAIIAINNSLIERGATLKEELNNFGVWTYFTNSRAIAGIYFEEAANYPLISLTTTFEFLPPSTSMNGSVPPTANNFVKINLPSGNDFFVTLISNGDAEAANINPNQFFSFIYSLFNYNEIGSELIVNNYYYIFDSPFESHFSVNHIFNDIASADEGFLSQVFCLYQNYPNPFNPITKIKYQIPELSFVIFKVYDALGNEVAILVNEEKTFGNYEVEFNAIGLSSGIYFYRIQAGSYIEIKKMVILK